MTEALTNLYNQIKEKHTHWGVLHYSKARLLTKPEYMNNMEYLKDQSDVHLKKIFLAAYDNDFYSITEAPNMPPISSLAETSFPRSMYTQD